MHFQAKFNLIIALIEFHEKEIKEVSRDVILSHAQSNVSYVEYRLMFPKDEPRDSFFRKLISACEGMILGEEVAKKEGFPIRANLAMSLHRDLNFERQYDWMKNWMEKEKTIKDKLVGIDFCHIEEGHSPKHKQSFFQQVLSDNRAETSTALSILYHVGESFRDKTPFSAVRWVLESAQYGAHRLGHALALGIDPDFFKGEERVESIAERIDQLKYEIENYETIAQFGNFFPKQELEDSLKEILSKPFSDHVLVMMDSKKTKYLETFQNYAMAMIAKTKAVIECCPTSNLYIGMLEQIKDHPLRRFLNSGLRVTIGSDDPGLFDSDLKIEYERANEAGVFPEELEAIRKLSFQYTSPILSGREILDQST
ncbi:adenosine deaminase [Leptospira ryugenii]|uniref:adenosine deaminase n=1 Tax=Leptospira ryugenii TaxID=1917863 RepID=UPI001FCE44ED